MTDFHLHPATEPILFAKVVDNFGNVVRHVLYSEPEEQCWDFWIDGYSDPDFAEYRFQRGALGAMQ